MAGLNILDVHTFFDTLCRNSGTDSLDIDSFVDAAFQMKGAASSMDVQTIMFQMQDVQKDLRNMEKRMTDRWGAMQR